MNETTGATYYFLPWVRQGAATAITQPETLGAGLRARAPVNVKVRVNANETDQVEVPLSLYGPGDVIGIDATEIVRVEPRHLTQDFPAHYFPFVEFDRPDFPWLFTPASATVGGGGVKPDRLRPWIVLVVVRKQGSRLDADPNRPLPTLECALSELPDLSESWAWAHSQYSGVVGADETIPKALAKYPQQSVSRLLCPRRLQASQGGTDPGYFACLVPAFKAGLQAGLAVPVADGDLQPAWEDSAAQPAEQRVTLPVYYHWEFAAVEIDDFEDLVDRLTLLKTLPDVPPRVMDISQPGEGLIGVPGAWLGVASALNVGDPPGLDLPPGLSPRDFANFKSRLQGVLEAPLQAPGKPIEAPPPPIYGAFHVSAAGTGASASTPSLDGVRAPAWFRGVNLDPRYRVATGLGVQVIQQEQEQLVAAAWDQAGQIERVNQWKRQKQAAREVAQSIHERRLMPLSALVLQQIAAPAMVPEAAPTKMPEASPMQAARRQALVAINETGLSTSFRRITRPLGPLSRRAAGSTLAIMGISARIEGAPPDLGKRFATVLEGAMAGKFELAPAPGIFAGAAAVTGYRPQPVPADVQVLPLAVPPQASVSATAKTTVLETLDPSRTFALEAQARVVVPPKLTRSGDGSDPLALAMFTPEFSQPMYEPLKELFQDMFLPGLDRVPHNSITLLSPDAAFIEAYMLGLNHELSRELLWREFPTDLHGTYFRQFWDVRGRLASAANDEQREALRDIPRIREWVNELGSNMPRDRAADLRFLLLKGDLLLRYPDALIYAAPAKWTKASSGQDVTPAVVDDSGTPLLPTLRLNPGFGVTLLGFTLPQTKAVGVSRPPGDAGYFFVIQEHPTEPRFGFDKTSDRQNTWRELSWPQVPMRVDGSGYVSVKGTAPTLTETAKDKIPEADKMVTWGTNSAHLAYIALQKPYRIEIHARFWLQ
jgi:hypothetical protein